MRLTLLTLACLIAGPALADNPTSLLNQKELAAVTHQNTETILVTPAQMQGVATSQFGPQYRSYVPLEIKSDNPGIMRTWDPNAHPGNASNLTPEGMACAADADCIQPLACFNRADSGMVPQKLCALPPGN